MAGIPLLVLSSNVHLGYRAFDCILARFAVSLEQRLFDIEEMRISGERRYGVYMEYRGVNGTLKVTPDTLPTEDPVVLLLEIL